MTTLKKYDIDAKEIGSVAIKLKKAKTEAKSQLIKDYIVALRENKRQWSASTKGRSEVNHSSQKPHKQKGTGKARQGYLGAPQYKGGGRVFGPKPKFDQKVGMNRKQKAVAVHAIAADKVEADSVIVLKDPKMKEPKAKTLASFLKKLGLDAKRTLFIKGISDSESKSDLAFQRSVRNLVKVECFDFNIVSGYDIAKASSLVILDTVEKDFANWMSSGERTFGKKEEKPKKSAAKKQTEEKA